MASCSLTDGEEEILALWDGGETDREEIARATGYAVNYVYDVVARYTVSDRSLSEFDRMSAAGTKSLLAALHVFHPETRRRVHP